MKKYRIAAFAAASVLLLGTLFSSCDKNNGKEPDANTPPVTTVPDLTLGFIDPEYPLMDLFAEDLSKYVAMGNIKDVKIKHNVYVDDAALDKEIKELAKKNGYYIADEYRKTKLGDTIEISYVGKIEGTTVSESKVGEFITLVDNNGYVEGFSDCLYDVYPEKTVNTTVTFPDNYGVAKLNGKTVDFEITVKAIVDEFGFTDESVKEYTSGAYQTYVEFREEYRENLIVTNLKKYDTEIYELAVKALEKLAEVKSLPEAHVDCYFHVHYNDELFYYETYAAEFRKNNRITSFEEHREYYGITDTYLKDVAELDVINDIILVSTAKALGLEFTDAEYDKLIEELVKEWGSDSSDQLIKYYGKDYLKLYVVKDQAVKALLKEVSIESDYDEYKHLLGEADAPSDK